MLSSTHGAALIQVRDLTRQHGAVVAANAVSFDVPRGQICGLLGPNGSGKSTTVRMLAGMLAPTSGRVTGFDGLDLVRDNERWKQRTGYMGQTCSLYLDLTVEENLQFFGSIYCLEPARLRNRIHGLANTLEIEPLLAALASALSIGQRQRVALAAALLHEPELLLLDEPTSGLDPRGRRLFWELIDELAAARGLTVVVTTQDINEAEQCDRLACMLDGRLIGEGRPNDLRERLRGTMATTAGVSCPADPSLDDVFESLARQQAALASAGAFAMES